MDKNFIKDAIRTESNDFCGIEKRMSDEENYKVLLAATDKAMKALDELDQVKKAIFYGKKKRSYDESFVKYGDVIKDNYDLNQKDIKEKVKELKDSDFRVLHGIIGIATEASELLTAIHSKLTEEESKDLDYVNLKEEIGDILWYMAIMADSIGFSFEEVADKVIAKLKVRYPEKFSLEKADKRALDKERAVLESNEEKS